MKLSSLEQEVIEWFISNNHNECLKCQCRKLAVIKREYTGSGVFVELSSSSECSPAEFRCVPNAPLISSPKLPHGASVDLWLESGYVSNLEFVALGDSLFPEEEFPYKLVPYL